MTYSKNIIQQLASHFEFIFYGDNNYDNEQNLFFKDGQVLSFY